MFRLVAIQYSHQKTQNDTWRDTSDPARLSYPAMIQHRRIVDARHGGNLNVRRIAAQNRDNSVNAISYNTAFELSTTTRQAAPVVVPTPGIELWVICRAQI
jgi:hypothetical protein